MWVSKGVHVERMSVNSITALEGLGVAVITQAAAGETGGDGVLLSPSLKCELSDCEVCVCVCTIICECAPRYPPSSRQASHEEGKEWLRSHSTGGLQDTGSQSPISPPGAACTTVGKYHYSNLRKLHPCFCVNTEPIWAHKLVLFFGSVTCS